MNNPKETTASHGGKVLTIHSEKRLLKPITYKGLNYDKGDYVSEEMVGNLTVGKDYEVVVTNKVIGEGQVKSRDASGNLKRNTGQIVATTDYLEDTNLTEESKNKAFQNERNAVKIEYNGRTLQSGTNVYNAYDVIDHYAKQIGGDNYTPEDFRKANEKVQEQIANGELKIN